MFELTINEVVYQFNFGMGFMREINKTLSAPVEGNKDIKKNIGLRFKVASLYDGDLEALVEILEAANKGQSPRVTRLLLDAYIDNPETDVDALIEEVLDFLRNANATKKTVAAIDEAVAAEKAKRANN